MRIIIALSQEEGRRLGRRAQTRPPKQHRAATQTYLSLKAEDSRGGRTQSSLTWWGRFHKPQTLIRAFSKPLKS